MSVNKAANILSVYPNRLWTVFNYWIGKAFRKDDQQSVNKIGIDETSSKKGHDYVTLAADLDARRVLFATPGKDESTINRFKQHFDSKGGKPERQHRYVTSLYHRC